MIYVIKCKNDFPPVNEYTIKSCHEPVELTSMESISYYGNKIVKYNEKLIFACFANDPPEAMIKFWEKYMYGG